MVRYSDYSITEIKSMLPYELIIYDSLLKMQIAEEKKQKGKV